MARQSKNLSFKQSIYLIKYFFVLFENSQTKVFKNMSIVVNPRNFVPMN